MWVLPLRGLCETERREGLSGIVSSLVHTIDARYSGCICFCTRSLERANPYEMKIAFA